MRPGGQESRIALCSRRGASLPPMADLDDSPCAVRAWTERVPIPTYAVGDPDRNPMFLHKRVYQGSSGAVYPFPVIDRIEDEKRDRDYLGVWLENEYLRILILPELGGRVQMALDKTNDFHFVYHNRVIKPALVGLTGPWISGGIEFNWPQHHRPSTFSPVDWDIEEHANGSRTVWCSEIDRMHGTKGMHGLRLHPGRAVLEVHVRLFNRTPEPQSFLWWANPAFHAGDGHQSVFPPDVRAVMDHGKRAVSEFPIAKGSYYKVDYSPGTDISRYRNIPVPTSYMAYRSDFDFVGSYDHEAGAGLLHVADHHVAPGKKQWTWGHGDFGRAWDRHLTDEDGPYIELMTGAFTDNQPDFTWLAPFEEKRFTQHFFPYKDVGMVKNASVDAALGLELVEDEVRLRAYVTAARPGAALVLRRSGEIWQRWNFDGSPASAFTASCPAEGAEERELQAEVLDSEGSQLVCFAPAAVREHGLPEAAQAIGAPQELDSTEELYFAGLHLEQYRHATREPADYYREGLRRDGGDARCNEALGMLLYRRGSFEEAREHFLRAVERVTRHNPNPPHGGPHYGLGLALERQERFEEAGAAFAKAAWCEDSRGPAHFALARLACRAGKWVEALRQAELALEFQAGNLRARHLRAWLLLQLDRRGEAARELAMVLASDPFQAGALFERSLLDPATVPELNQRLGTQSRNYLELARDYLAAGLDERAVLVLEGHVARCGQCDDPLVHDTLADCLRRLGRPQEAAEEARLAAALAPTLCFPSRLESIGLLQRSMAASPNDARIPYALGNLWYSKHQPQKAIAAWERAREIDPGLATLERNLGLAAFNAQGDPDRAWRCYQRAFELDPGDARVLFELDQLAKRSGHDPRERLVRLEAYPTLVARRDDLSLERASLLNLLGRHQEALALLLGRRFHPWEGGEGKVTAQYVLALCELARAALAAGSPSEALEFIEEAREWPESLGEGKLAGHRSNSVDLLRGLALRELGREEEARVALEEAASGLADPRAAIYYNDQPPETIYSQGLALQLLGREDEASARFLLLHGHGEEQLGRESEIDYFAVSLPDFLVFDADLDRDHELHSRFLMALGLTGLGRHAEADGERSRVLALDPSHCGARLLRTSGSAPRI